MALEGRRQRALWLFLPPPNKPSQVPGTTLLCLDDKQGNTWGPKRAYFRAGVSEANWPPQPYMARCWQDGYS